MAKLWDMMQKAEAKSPKPKTLPKAQDVPAPHPIAKPKSGRPRIEDKGKTLSDSKPWLALGMSRSSWYLRRKDGRLKQ